MPKKLTTPQTEELLSTLKTRFEKHQNRHPKLNWTEVEAKLKANPAKLWSLYQMESTGGEPDVVAYDKSTDEFTFFDCSPESPKGRRSLCYDRAALDSRKEHKPVSSAVDMATEMGIQLLNEDQYRELQSLGEFDLKTSSWVDTPAEIRKLDGALFGDRRYNHVFFYHNGASSYYGARGFRGFLKV
jgi:hypothetical protein